MLSPFRCWFYQISNWLNCGVLSVGFQRKPAAEMELMGCALVVMALTVCLCCVGCLGLQSWGAHACCYSPSVRNSTSVTFMQFAHVKFHIETIFSKCSYPPSLATKPWDGQSLYHCTGLLGLTWHGWWPSGSGHSPIKIHRYGCKAASMSDCGENVSDCARTL